ncbi:hypothetical protein [Shinella sp. WSJ-2]|uniref:hypothetical protein n=1 Tax=Shinella sp. WSJ-2 TaxID=2303749 RepID=UPI0018F5E88E|nr:hypothetical protein [Shinella sp. WSJ-2]
MADRPILFSRPMVLALLDGRKTQTRRIIKPRSKNRPSLFDGSWSDSYVLDPGNESWRQDDILIKVGDRLWVRETLTCCTDWGLFYDAHGGIGPSEEHFLRDDRAEPIVDRYSRDDETLWNVPSIFMPRWASRLTLTVTDVRVERLCSITDEDAIAEGILPDPDRPGWWMASTDEADRCPTPRDAYLDLWNSINGDGASRLDPWVVADTFTVERRNIDAPANTATGSSPSSTDGGKNGG